MNLDKFAADLIEALLKDFCETFPRARDVVATMDGDVYGWKVARAEALADRLKREMLLAPALKSEEMRKLMASVRDESLRDNFAGLALASEFEAYGRFTQTSEEAQQKHRDHVARQCYLMADAMLAARNPEPKPAIVEVDEGEMTEAEKEVEKFNSEPFVVNARKVLGEISRPPHVGETPGSRFKELQTMVNELFPF